MSHTHAQFHLLSVIVGTRHGCLQGDFDVFKYNTTKKIEIASSAKKNKGSWRALVIVVENVTTDTSW